MKEQLDIDLLQALDDASWARAEELYSGRLMAYIGRRIGDSDAREDVLQDTFLGAVRGIARFDRAFQFEQYLFGICRNRTIDHLRRGNRGRGTGYGPAAGGDHEDGDIFDSLPVSQRSPSSLVGRDDLVGRGNELLGKVLVAWVAETWAAEAYERLCVMESVLMAGRRNKDLVEELGLRDEGVVAGIRFRAMKRLAALAKEHEGSNDLTTALAALAADGPSELNIAEVWRVQGVSCPARHWLARWRTGALEGGAERFLKLHVDDHGCPLCEATLADLEEAPRDMHGLLGRLRLSQAQVLHSVRLNRENEGS